MLLFVQKDKKISSVNNIFKYKLIHDYKTKNNTNVVRMYKFFMIKKGKKKKIIKYIVAFNLISLVKRVSNPTLSRNKL